MELILPFHFLTKGLHDWQALMRCLISRDKPGSLINHPGNYTKPRWLRSFPLLCKEKEEMEKRGTGLVCDHVTMWSCDHSWTFPLIEFRKIYRAFSTAYTRLLFEVLGVLIEDFHRRISDILRSAEASYYNLVWIGIFEVCESGKWGFHWERFSDILISAE